MNTHAVGAFLNALLAKAQRACCAEIEIALGNGKPDDFESAVLGMFQHEWCKACGGIIGVRIRICLSADASISNSVSSPLDQHSAF